MLNLQSVSVYYLRFLLQKRMHNTFPLDKLLSNIYPLIVYTFTEIKPSSYVKYGNDLVLAHSALHLNKILFTLLGGVGSVLTDHRSSSRRHRYEILRGVFHVLSVLASVGQPYQLRG